MWRVLYICKRPDPPGFPVWTEMEGDRRRGSVFEVDRGGGSGVPGVNGLPSPLFGT